MNALLHQVTIEHVFMTSYRPRLNGRTERVHRWRNSDIGIYCEKYQSRREEFLQPAVYAHNTSPVLGTKNISLLFLVFGRHAPCPETLALDLPPLPLSRDTHAHQLVSR